MDKSPGPGATAGSRRRALMGAGIAGMAGGMLVAGCGPGGDRSPAAGSDEPAKLLWEIRSGATYEELAKEGLALFKQRFPRVEIEYFPKPSQWEQKHLASMAAGSGPDVFQAWDQFFWLFASKGVVLNVNDLLRDYRKADLDDFVQGQWAGFQIPGTNLRYGMPTYINTGVVYYNKNRFQRAGVPEPAANWTYDDYADKAKRLTRMEGSQQLYGVNHPTNNYVRIQNHLWAFGGGWVDPRDFTKYAGHLPPAQQALQWLHDRYWKDNSWIRPGQRPSGFNFWGGLGSGLIAMAEDGMHALKDVARLEGVDWDIASIPKGPAAKMSWITTDGWGIWKETRARRAAWELVKFLTDADFLKLQSRIELLIPPRNSLVDDWMQVLRQKFPVLEKVNLRLVRDALRSSPPVVRTWQQFPCYGDMIEPMQEALNLAFRDGTAGPTLFRDRKEEIERAANACGATFK